MHLGPAHLLQGHGFADHHLRHPRRAQVHRGVAVAHDHDVAEGGDVGAAGGARPEEQADLRHLAGEPHLVVEDPPGAAAAGEHLHLVGDPRPGRVDQVDHRQLQAQRPFLDAEDLLDRLRPPGAGLDRGVVGHQGDAAAVDRGQAGDDAVGPEALLVPVGQGGLLDEGAGVDQPLDPLAHRQLALLLGLLVVALRPPGEGGLERLREVGHAPGAYSDRHASSCS